MHCNRADTGKIYAAYTVDAYCFWGRKNVDWGIDIGWIAIDWCIVIGRIYIPADFS